MAQAAAEDAGSVHLTIDADNAAAAARVSIVDQPPEYSAQDCSISNDRDQEPPPPPYTLPQEHPPPYQTPPCQTPSCNRTFSGVRYTPGQSNHLTIGLRSGQQQPRIVYQPSNLSFMKLLLACAVFWLCGFLFGAVAYLLAKLSLRTSETPRQQLRNLYLGRASIIVSLMGIALGAVALTVGLSFARGMSASSYLNSGSATTAPSHDTYLNQTTIKSPGDAAEATPCYRISNSCFSYVSTYGPRECSKINGVVGYDTELMRSVCYHNICADYSVEGKCFIYRSALLTRVQCRTFDGLYHQTISGWSCYYNACPGVLASDFNCYRTRRSSTRAECVNGFYDSGYCYTT